MEKEFKMLVIFQFDIDDMYNKCKEFEGATKDANDAR